MANRTVVPAVMCLAIFATMVVPSRAGDGEDDRLTLKGLKSMRVVCDIEPAQERFGVTRQQLQTDTELQLRKANIKVQGTVGPFLYVNVNVVESGLKTYAVALELSFHQTVSLQRMPSISSDAVTWVIFPVVLTVPHEEYPEFCRRWVRDLADRFANAFLSVNRQ